MNLSFIKTTIAQAVSVNNIEEEVAMLLQASRDQVGLFEAMDEWLANCLSTLPAITEGDVIIRFENSRGFTQFVSKNLSDCLWVSAMKQLQYHGGVNVELLATAFMNWINTNVYTSHEDLGRTKYTPVIVSVEDMHVLAKETIATMQHVEAIESSLVKKVVTLENKQQITAKVYQLHAALKDELNGNITLLRERAVMKCRPLVHQPMDWTSATDGVAPDAKLKLVKAGNYKVRNKKVSAKVLSAVNKLQRVRFTVSPSMLEVAKDMKLKGQLYKGEQFKSMFGDKELNSEAFDIYNEIETLRGKEFYFPVSMDKRGRMYYRGGLLSPQGVDFCKAAFQFANYKPLGKHGFKALCIHAANVLGCDKESINGRVKFIREQWDNLMHNVNTHMDIRRQYAGADTFQALVAVKELQRLASLDGEWSEKTSNLVCHQDGTCNGLQHMAAITGDRPTAVAVNCVASGHDDKPADIYGIIAMEAARICGDETVRMLILKYARAMAKNPVMVTGYGATESTIVNNTRKFLAQKGEDVSLAQDIGEAYLEAIANKAGAVTQLTEALKERMNYAMEDGLRKAQWITADGFVAQTCYENDEAISVRVGKFFIRKRGQGKQPIDAMKTAQAMSPNFVHSIDATHLRMVINACDFELVTVHDSIGSHPCDFFETGRMIREKFTLVHNGYDHLGDLCFAIKQEVPEFPAENDYNASEALNSAYIFS